MSFYDINKNIELANRRAVKDHLFPVGLPRRWDDQIVEQFGVYQIIIDPKPEITELQVIEQGPVEVREDGKPYRTWVVSDRFSDTETKTKQEQETEYLATLQEKANATLKASCEKAIEAHIQAQVDAYNDANGLVFTDVKSCALYAQMPSYSHQPFCAAVWDWNVQVWESARAALTQALAGEITITGPDDAIALLPAFEFEEV